MAEALAAEFPVVPVDVGRLFLAEFRTLTAELGTAWEPVLHAEGTQTGVETPDGLASYIRRVMDRPAPQVISAGAPGSVLLLHDAAPLARYHTSGGRELLNRLQAAARRPGEAPHGLWLLCPCDDPVGMRPNLDGRVVETIDSDAERLILGRTFISRLLGESAAWPSRRRGQGVM